MTEAGCLGGAGSERELSWAPSQVRWWATRAGRQARETFNICSLSHVAHQMHATDSYEVASVRQCQLGPVTQGQWASSQKYPPEGGKTVALNDAETGC